MVFRKSNKTQSLQKTEKSTENNNDSNMMMTRNLKEANVKLGKLIYNYDYKL